tara:strand:- start:970 stop:1539 length:570 start_codon:yes stop_codon:yes gene_type:complete
MKIKEYNQMMKYLTRPKDTDPKKLLEKMSAKELVRDNKKVEKNMIQQVVKNSPVKIDIEEILDKYEDGFESKKNTKVAMSETPKEEAEMMLGGEAVEFMKWLKKNPNGTYKDWLKDKTAMLTDEQKKDKKIIDLTPFLPSFEEELRRMEEREKEKEKETLKDFMNRRSREMKLSEKDNVGLSSLLSMKN